MPKELLEMAQADPSRALTVGTKMLEQDPQGEARSIVLRAMGIAARLGATMTESIEYGMRSVEVAREANSSSALVGALVTLAGSLAISGQNVEALELLAEAASISSGLDHAEVTFQRASVLARMGQLGDAEIALRAALPVFDEHQHAELVALTLQNLGRIDMMSGRLDEAETQLLRARGLFEDLEFDIPVAAVDHSLGVLASYRGDLVGSLRLLDESESRYGELVEEVAEIQVSRCEVLLSAGLVSESARLATSIAEVLSKLGLAEDEAEARLVAAQATLVGGDREAAIQRAIEARDLFDEQGRETWRAQAEQVEISALADKGQANQELLRKARDVADRLEQEQQAVASLNAHLTAASIAMAMGDLEGAQTDLALVAEQKKGPVEMRLQSWLGEALLYDLRGDRRRAMAAARSGMELLDRYQAALGASDVRAGIEMHARKLGDLGLRLAVETGDGRTAFQWMERSRARSLRSRPVSPPADDEMLSQLADLRQVTAKMRGASGSEAVELRNWERSLQETIRRRARMTPGMGRPLDLGDIARNVEDQLDGGTLIEFGSVAGRTCAVVVSGGEFELRQTGAVGAAVRELESLRFMLRRLARRGADRGETHLEVAGLLDELLFGGLVIEDGPLVVVPTSELYASPWSILPSVRHQSMTVAPSAELWLRRSAIDIGGGSVVVAGGPGLEEAGEEVRAVGNLYESPQVWAPEESRVEEVLTAMNAAAVAHIASHAFFQFENPMFSSLRLGDGDLFVYDLERLRRPPGVVILSACDSGFSQTRAGEELLGLSASLLAMGTSTVVASIGLVPDSDATRDLMVRFHEGLLGGLDPALALRRAQDLVAERPGGLVAAASFICVGAG